MFQLHRSIVSVVSDIFPFGLGEAGGLDLSLLAPAKVGEHGSISGEASHWLGDVFENHISSVSRQVGQAAALALFLQPYQDIAALIQLLEERNFRVDLDVCAPLGR